MSQASSRTHLEHRYLPGTARAVADGPTLVSATLLSGRVLISAVFVISGFLKVTASKATIAYIAAAGLPFPQLGLAIGIATELAITPLFVLGYRTRCMASLLAAYCLVTAIFFHSNFSDQDMLLHFFKNIAMAGGLLQIVACGGGRFSLDARLNRHS